MATENSPIKIEGSHTVADVEEWLSRLEECPQPCDLKINTHLRHRQFGGLASLIQLLFTWYRRSPNAKLITYLGRQPVGLEQEAEAFINYDHGLVAALLTPVIHDREGRPIPGELMLRLALERLKKAMTIEASRRGSKVLLLSADHTTCASPPTLYRDLSGSEPLVRDGSGFKDIAERLVTMLTVGPGTITPPAPLVESFGVILYELFRNTHDWARHDASGARLSPSIRGIRAELYSHSHSVHLEMTAKVPPINRYLSHPQLSGVGTQTRFMEVSVFDSGPGLAARRLSERIDSVVSADEYYAATLECLRTNYTSATTSHRGQGLHQVMKLLTGLRGFLRIRSGCVSLQRDFLSSPYSPGKNNEPFLLDWYSNEHGASPLAQVRGTCITFIFPLNYE